MDENFKECNLSFKIIWQRGGKSCFCGALIWRVIFHGIVESPILHY